MTNGRLLAVLLLSVVGARDVFGQTLAANAGPAPLGVAAPLQEIRARIGELERQLNILKAQLAAATTQADGTEIRREAQAEQARTSPAIGASRDGFQLRSADGAFALRMHGILQSDSRLFVDDAAETGTDTFLLRRVRPMIAATLFQNFDLRLVPDFGNGQTVVQDAYMDLEFATAFRVRAGKQKQPFGLERLVSSSDLQFVERALPTTVAGNRDIGVMAYGDLFARRVSYFAGAFNGVADGSSADLDDSDGKDVVVRLFTHPFRAAKDERLQEIGIGVAASYGSHRGTAAAPAVAAYRTAGQQTFFRYFSDGSSNGTTIADGTRRRFSAQGYYYAGRFGLLAEQAFSSQRVRRGNLTAAAETNSWQLTPSWVLTGQRSTYRGVVPRVPFDPVNGTWGAFELTARYNQLSVGDELFPVFADPSNAAARARGGAVGLNWYMNRHVKLVFNYEETRFVGGAAAGANRRSERDFLSRVQFSF